MTKKVLIWAAATLLILICSLVMATYVNQDKTVDAPYPDIHSSADSAVVARGRYLAYGPAHCVDCHSPKQEDEDLELGKEVSLSGGRDFVLPVGIIRSANLTSDPETGLGNVSDSAIARALRYGVGHDGRILPPFMPFQNMANEDLRAIISFLRSLPPVHRSFERYDLNFAGKMIKAFVLEPLSPETKPWEAIMPDTSVAYGKYLANNVSDCKGCHTQRNMTGAYTGVPFAGGYAMKSPIDPEHHVATSVNLTPDAETGRIYNWTADMFINRFRQGRLSPHSVMPWVAFKNMSDNELKAIFYYLKSLDPVSNKVEQFTEVK